METEKRLIDEWLPLKEINFDVDIEMAFKFLSKEYHKKFEEIYGFKPRAINTRAPRVRNLHLWLARRPCGAARALTLAALFPPTADREFFKKALGLDAVADLIDLKLPPIMILINPKKDIVKKLIQSQFNRNLNEIVLVDPMAGGGSIPLESLRLGLKTVAIEYNPVAYLILKAMLEYPAKYGERLYEDVRREARALIQYAKDELSKYYAEDAYNYIIARGFQCPKEDCSGLVPVVHGTRLRQDGPYIKFQFNKEEKKFKVSTVNEETKFEKLRCPYCDRPFTRDEMFSQWVLKHKEILKIALGGDVEEARNHTGALLRTHIPLIKQVRRGFAPCDDEDVDKLVHAYLDLAKQVKEFKPYLPSSLIPKENQVFEPVKSLGIDYWYELFNPRQLLVFLKLIRYVSERAKELIKDNGEYGVAIATYLALGLDKLLNYNNITTMWHTRHGVMKGVDAHYSAKRSVSLSLEYCEAKRIDLALDWAFEPDVDKPHRTGGGICPVLNQLCDWLYGLGDRVEVYMGDARELSKIIGEQSVDLVNVDPPYFNQHFYSDLTEFFWQVLMLTLKPAMNTGFLFNRDKNRGRIECLVSGWSPSLPIVPRSGEIIVRGGKRKLDVAEVSFTKEWWREQMWKFFTEAYNVLKDDGFLIVWYTHTDPKAWEAVLSGLYASKFIMSKVWNVRTEMTQRQVALERSAFFTSLSLIARKTGDIVIVGESTPKELLLNEQVKEVITESVIDALKSAKESGASDREAYIMALAGAIAGATRIHNPGVESAESVASETLNKYIGKAREQEIAKRMFYRTTEFFRDKLYPVALYLGASKVLEEELLKAGLSEEEIKLIIGADDITKAYLVFWLSTRYYAEGIKPFIDYDFAEKICKVLGIRISEMDTYGLVKKLQNNAYTVLFGGEMFEAVKNRLEFLDRTIAGQAMHLLKFIVESPIRDDEERCAKDVISRKTFSKQAIATATFLLRTATKEELEGASISEFRKPFVEGVLKTLYSR
jgi:adenine-specific DNA methylase